MKQYLVIVALAAIAAILAYTNIKTVAKARHNSALINQWQRKYNDCITAKIKRDTVYIYKYDTTAHIIIKHATDSILISDTVNTQPMLRFYQDSVQMADLTLHYKAQTLGTLKWVKFNYKLRDMQITEGTIIYKDSIRTVIKKPKLTAYVFAEAGLTKPAISVGAMATFKGIGGSYRYDITNSTHNAGIVFRLK